MFYDDDGNFKFKEFLMWFVVIIVVYGLINNAHKILAFIDRLFDGLP